jgi:hypothetical protein
MAYKLKRYLCVETKMAMRRQDVDEEDKRLCGQAIVEVGSLHTP